ncbi:MAG: hypothetical protein HC764_26765 [Pleurocapsa sp. CRU_1_2]|nr:hypothetical protein [Pleurocapsa sp. CRU_1_2]
MSNDIRSLITSGSRAKVPLRDASINSNPDQPYPKTSSTTEIEKLETELSQLPKNGKRLAIHLEKGLRNKFVSYCSQEEITPETFIEASLFILQQYPDLQSQITQEAHSRLLLRKRAGFIRRTISMLKGI